MYPIPPPACPTILSLLVIINEIPSPPTSLAYASPPVCAVFTHASGIEIVNLEENTPLSSNDILLLEIAVPER